ncbi:hypothetical protein PHSY_000017 [Pseudozyma hubeiensis SY62]|uniref:Uncharacterized protein n=1 Tax=Pseudozyma hubeiensis (strain SY62) TaxID=1305764 RepID=R9NVK0_PSEHS|nr:hypothetical protein PHSY_000017 [Pseudozyma hubeiensis SY62]GAC92464.1 hypothetical protein PHSY_000017 [Pseudozyma hubeiensis SY62]
MQAKGRKQIDGFEGAAQRMQADWIDAEAEATCCSQHGLRQKRGFYATSHAKRDRVKRPVRKVACQPSPRASPFRSRRLHQ